MTEVIYKILQHDGGWAYQVGETYSETFQTHDAALGAARRAAAEQQVGGQTRTISWEDSTGQGHREVSDGGERPDTTVVD
ncbi:DUF2188 domain-containing protein [Brevundimonas sp.]|uniref:DUF2188 domain-containing protein n=1 Tax=Brevundimonas sp. TaxID=1871086 RepID=UPI003514D197